MIVVGGTHREICLRPAHSALLGPGVTGAMVAAILGSKVAFFSVTDASERERVGYVLRAYGVETHIATSSWTITFRYATPLSVPSIFPRPDSMNRELLRAEDDDALVYGMLDALPKVSAKRVVYDPQSAWLPLRFRAQLGGAADRLAYVLNAREIGRLQPGISVSDAARTLMREESAEIVVVKDGLNGALVVDNDGEHRVPAYSNGRGAHLIGSGDIFSAAFASRWFSGSTPIDAATVASRMVANFVVDGIIDAINDPLPERTIAPWSGNVYIAAPFFTLAEQWLVDEVRFYIEELGMKARSPLHEIGIGDADRIARGDLALLEQCERIIAICDGRDPGTIFEAGYATKNRIPVWAVSTSTREIAPDQGDLRMLLGSGSRIFDDLTAALVDMATNP